MRLKEEAEREGRQRHDSCRISSAEGLVERPREGLSVIVSKAHLSFSFPPLPFPFLLQTLNKGLLWSRHWVALGVREDDDTASSLREFPVKRGAHSCSSTAVIVENRNPGLGG